MYKDSETKKQVESIENEYKNNLLNILGKLATHTDMIYPDIKELERKIKENGLTNKLKQMQTAMFNHVKYNSPLMRKVAEKLVGKNFNTLKFKAANYISGPDTAGMLDLAHGEDKMNNPAYIKDAIKLKNYNDPKISQFADYLKKKVPEQFNSYGFNPDNIPGYYFKSNSEPSQRMIQNKDFRAFIKNNKDRISKTWTYWSLGR